MIKYSIFELGTPKSTLARNSSNNFVGGIFMDTSAKNLEKVRKLLEQLSVMEEAKDVWTNYDRRLYAQFWTGHNSNLKQSKTVSIQLPPELQKPILQWVDDEIFRLKKELEKL